MNGPHTRTLLRALESVGGSKPRLSAALAISADDLEAYLAGKTALPHQVFLDALDIVAGSNHNIRAANDNEKNSRR